MKLIFDQGPSPAGFHAVSTYLECPEKSRLKALGIRKKGTAWVPGDEMNALGYGLLIHAAMAIRGVYGNGTTISWLEWLPDICEEDRNKSLTMMKVYDLEYPHEMDNIVVLGVEVPVTTEIAPGVMRTVRYDNIVRLKGADEVYPMENKTSARGGRSGMASYSPQMAVQVGLWNANKALVEKYGPMRAGIFNVLIKTVVPRCERIGPDPISRFSQMRALEYLKHASTIEFPVAEDGSYPRFAHSCWGKYSPCEYIDLCWHDAAGAYEQAPLNLVKK